MKVNFQVLFIIITFIIDNEKKIIVFVLSQWGMRVQYSDILGSVVFDMIMNSFVL